MTTDVSTFVGSYAYRTLPDVSADHLLREMDRIGIATAWVGYLPSCLTGDPRPDNQRLVTEIGAHLDRLCAVHTINPDLPRWQEDLHIVAAGSGVAIRVYPMHLGLQPDGPGVGELVVAAGRLKLATILTVRFEDVRQRHPADQTGDLPPSAVRTLVRLDPGVRLIVTHASREFIQEVHFGLTTEEASRVLYDISWLWGPPGNDLELLVATIGADRLVFGTCMPLRIPDAVIAKLELSEIEAADHARIRSHNLIAWKHQQ